MRLVLGALGGFLGWLLWALHVRRRVVMDNLRLAFPEWTEARRRQVARQIHNAARQHHGRQEAKAP